VSVSAHGTGAKLPPLDMAVVSMKVVTPGLGTLVLSKDNHPDLFELAKVCYARLIPILDTAIAF
jgi:hypothetical protein